MYYEEQVIDGQLCYRNAPDAPWAVLEYHYVVTRLLRAEKKVNTFDQAREALKLALDYYRSKGTQKFNPYEIEQQLEKALAAMEATP